MTKDYHAPNGWKIILYRSPWCHRLWIYEGENARYMHQYRWAEADIADRDFNILVDMCEGITRTDEEEKVG
jgi:hypothetical protein